MERAEHILVLTADARFVRALDVLLVGSGFGPTSRVATVAELLARRDVDAHWPFVAIDVKDVPDAAGVIARTARRVHSVTDPCVLRSPRGGDGVGLLDGWGRRPAVGNLVT